MSERGMAVAVTRNEAGDGGENEKFRVLFIQMNDIDRTKQWNSRRVRCGIAFGFAKRGRTVYQ